MYNGLLNEKNYSPHQCGFQHRWAWAWYECMTEDLIDTFTLALEQHYFELRWGAQLYMDFFFFSRVNSTVLHKPWTSVGNPYTIQSSLSVMSDSLQPRGLQHTGLPCPLPTHRACSNSCPSCWWCHPTISSSIVPFSSCLQSFPASGSFPMSQLASGGQSIGVSASASVLPMNIQDWSPLGWTGLVSLQSKGLSRVFSNITVQKHQFLGAQLSL